MLISASTVAALVAALPGLTAVQAPPPKNPVVVIETSLGDITVELDRARAPITVENFLAYVRAGFYKGTIFHRVIKRFMIQGGGLTADMQRKPTRPPIKNEAANGLSNTRGTIAMARTSDPDSATSQFFINTADNTALDHGRERTGGYAVFGRVTAGMDVVDKIESVPTTSRAGHENVPVEPVVIKNVRIVGP
ncbi:MAG TPA: peptidylprolyl isomerase [Vicinamibacterales bacterium]|nr:peptidylprolyl isomerase [Vicinamibacterales bacterium]